MFCFCSLITWVVFVLLWVVCSFASLVWVTLVVVLRLLVTVFGDGFGCVVCFMWLIWSHICWMLVGSVIWWMFEWFCIWLVLIAFGLYVYCYYVNSVVYVVYLPQFSILWWVAVFV